MFVDYGIFSFTDINIGGLTAVWPPSVYFLNVTSLYKLIDGSLDSRHTAFRIFSYPFVRRIAVFVLTLSVAQVSVDTLRGKRQVISEDHLVAFHRRFLLPR